MHPKLGMEIEANWPRVSQLNPELREQLSLADAAASGIPRPNTSYYVNDDTSDCYQAFINCSNHDGRPNSRGTGVTAHLTKFFEFVNPKFWFPENWRKQHDAGVEGCYSGPAESLAQAEGWTKTYAQWLRDFGFTAFSSAGTHVHLGHVEWLDEKFGKDINDPKRIRAEGLMWGYFATREAGIFAVTPKHRITCGSCPPIFTGRGAYAPATKSPNATPSYTPWITGTQKFSSVTPAWAFHNHLVMNWTIGSQQLGGFSGGSIQPRRKGLPTLEFRFFAGTHATTALIGYLRLLHNMFLEATKVITEENIRARDENSLTATVVVNPYSYGVEDLLAEVKDPWVKEWIKRTVKNRGEPLIEEISVQPSMPQAVAAAA